MPRLLLVACLIVTVPLAGCVTHRPVVRAVAEKPEDAPRPAWVEYPDWLDNHPLLRTAVYGTGMVALGVSLTVGLAVLWVVTHAESNSDNSAKSGQELRTAAIKKP